MMYDRSLRGKCKEMSEALCVLHDDLTLVRGYYHCLFWGKQEHWWCVKPNGDIVDLTIGQFPSSTGTYEEFDGSFDCEECGLAVSGKDAIPCGRFVVCSDKCALRLVGL